MRKRRCTIFKLQISQKKFENIYAFADRIVNKRSSKFLRKKLELHNFLLEILTLENRKTGIKCLGGKIRLQFFGSEPQGPKSQHLQVRKSVSFLKNLEKLIFTKIWPKF